MKPYETVSLLLTVSNVSVYLRRDNTHITLLLISLMVLYFESFDSAEAFSLCCSLLELVISIIGLTGGVDMVSISIVVGIGSYGGKPDNRVMASKLKAIPFKKIEDKPSGFNPRTSTNCGFARTRKPQSKGCFVAFSLHTKISIFNIKDKK